MRFLITAILGAYAVAAIPGTSSPVVDMGVAILRARAGCNAPGVVNGECGKVYDFQDCTGNEVWRIQPDCTQTCIKVTDKPVVSVRAMGDGTYGTTCYLYPDSNCQSEVRRTSNSATGEGSCVSAIGQTVGSWKCTFKC
ncbi:hypothetical protein SLS53_004488 [Cytospora paraplurivora]|uniref:Uncharacterized protein n=1 Tax=Cytospora paraplurivora TaxID=2898453 RepID=A0AAN9YH96_9PEZI